MKLLSIALLVGTLGLFSLPTFGQEEVTGIPKDEAVLPEYNGAPSTFGQQQAQGSFCIECYIKSQVGLFDNTVAGSNSQNGLKGPKGRGQ